MPVRIGVDLGGTKIECVALDHSGREIFRRRVDTPPGDYAATVEAIVRLVAEAERELGERGTVGVATPGSLSRATGRMKNSNSLCLNDQPLLQDLEQRLARPVRIANDANCFALSEAVDGAATGARNVFGIILGTGVGGGIVFDRKVVDGPNGIAGEWGHNALPRIGPDDWPQPVCYCGRAGCVETYLSGPGMAGDHQRRTRVSLTARQIAEQAATGDAACRATLERYCDRLARALGAVINILDPDVIVAGGGVSNIDALYREVPQRWSAYVFSDDVRTRFARNRHGDSSGVRGAAWLWND
ncbi:MAG: ROK family protein [Gemmatimonadota bacterium]